ncbi:hypothetical protein CONLIGDRAFT_646546 [Coniochaeta ligniaria NRRL 30616]|uniref:Uncharacterized protein n=1 Tax=Coniochaeta ligniaria NRRL 30616 TaxID=1408157 RepID=A0A1J7IZ59_9PEZI|nr:hypothetical protein CONLIGDRAFT_646546 [Coniochaeta ligniaria NRRL 30616]
MSPAFTRVDSETATSFRLFTALHIESGLTYLRPHGLDDSSIMQQLPLLLPSLITTVRTRLENLGLLFDPDLAARAPAWMSDLRALGNVGKIWFIDDRIQRRAGACSLHDNVQTFRQDHVEYVEVERGDEGWQIPPENNIFDRFTTINQLSDTGGPRQFTEGPTLGVLACVWRD